MTASRWVWIAGAVVALSACSPEEEETGERGPAWEPGVVYRAEASGDVRGLVDRRGVIHAHSVHSYDACDEAPKDANGAIDQVCFEDFRRGLCQSAHDFVMLTDHRDTFSQTEFPETLLFRPEQGDELVERNGGPVASWAECPEGRMLVMAGAEADTMPVGLERHVAPTVVERDDVYGSATPEAIEALRAAGAVVLVAHTEGWSVDDLVNLPLDGFEMYNVHFNAILSAMDLFSLVRLAGESPADLPHPDLALLPVVKELDIYLERWGSALARDVRRVATMGTDCHRNSFPQMLPDGERLDSYRRMLIAYSNHLLIRPESDGSWDDRHLKEALGAGRLYGAFEYLGYPVGFDYHALEAGQPREMGEQVSLAAGVELSVRMPKLDHADPELAAPELTARILKAREGGWDEVASGSADLRHVVTEPGAYRAEIRMRALHLVPYLSSYAYLVEQRDFVWIYSNAIYVVP